MTEATQPPYRRVGREVELRRAFLEIDQAALAREAMVDAKTVRGLERGERWPRTTSRAKIERALKWPTGRLDQLLANEGLSPDAAATEAGQHPGEWPAAADISAGVQGAVVVVNRALDSGASLDDVERLITAVLRLATDPALQSQLDDETVELVSETHRAVLARLRRRRSEGDADPEFGPVIPGTNVRPGVWTDGEFDGAVARDIRSDRERL
ncbi:helix-turn-helix domain-containing protein [Nocardia tengchongensis]|uniref:helix-turn-helix domain-containing protein n=1 Tax=Nocardia tengchongensis TaxID=2055889 RepID=UPI003611F5BB